jgi:dTMP kinase
MIYNINEENSHLVNANNRGRRGKLIVLEGFDGAGKSSQIKLIAEEIEKQGKTYKHVHFPMYGENMFADVVSMFLRGDLGSLEEVDPLFLANIYGMDRYKYKPQLVKHLDHYDYVILDRYVFSNMAFQGAKYHTDEKRQSIVKWIEDFEFKFLQLPYPDTIIYFDLPIDVIKERLTKRDEEEDREYLEGKKDVHEADLIFQSRVRNIYLGIDIFENYNIVKCLSDEGEVLSPEDLYDTYKDLI